MTSADFCIVGAIVFLAGLGLAALISTPIVEIRDDEYPQGPFRHPSDIDQK